MRTLLSFLLLSFCCLSLSGQNNFEDKIAAIKELPLAERKTRFEEAISADNSPPLQLARYHHELGVVNYIQKDIFKAIEHTKVALTIRLKYEEDAGEEVVFSAYNLGSFHHLVKDYKQAFDHFQLIVDRRPNSRIGYTLFRLGHLYMEMGELKLSEKAFQEASKEDPFPDDIGERAILLKDWADVYLKQDDPKAAKAAIPLLKEAFEAFDKLATEDEFYAPDASISLNRLGMAYTYAENFPQAFKTFGRALRYNEKCCNKRVLEAAINTNLGIAYRRSGKPRKALEYYQRALAIRNPDAQAEAPSISIAREYDNMATALLHLAHYEKGLIEVQTALKWALPNFSPQKLFQNPSLESLRTSLNKNSLLIFLQDKGDLWRQLAIDQENDQYFDAAIETYQLCDQLIDLIREDHLEKTTKLFWCEQARKMYQSAVKAAWLADRPEMAFYFSEKSRSVLLLDGLQELNAHSRLPETTQISLTALASKIKYLEQNIYEQEQNAKPNLESQLLLLQQEYRHLLDSIEQTYPDYYRQKYKPEFVNLMELQKNIATDEIWVEYFLADDFSLALIIASDHIKMVELASSQELDPHIQGLLTGLNNYQEAFDPQAAAALYEYLIAPLNLEVEKKLVLVPDAQLSLIPFESLLQEIPAENSPYNEWDFLLHFHQISYAFSANSHFFKPLEARKNNGRILAFAPMAILNPAYGIDAALELPESRFTIEGLADRLPTDIYFGESANRTLLKELGPQAAVLHLATHAYLNHEQPEFSYFLLADQDPDKRRFYLNELYQDQYQADLAVLSACETGAGKLFRGEGIASIGRAFAQNGCPNLAMSLWPVDEGATGKLLGYFYQKLEQGVPKAEALYEAKKDYLKQTTNDKLNHPFRWAGMVYYGSDTSLQLRQTTLNNKSFFWVLFGSAFLGILFFRSRRRNKV